MLKLGSTSTVVNDAYLNDAVLIGESFVIGFEIVSFFMILLISLIFSISGFRNQVRNAGFCFYL